nr:MAG TPA: hypothetical protein [Caudoviricetes sp.]
MNIKQEFNNGMFDCLEIWHPTHKIKEISNNMLWNATKENPIYIAKSRLSDYVVSDELLDEDITKNMEE